MWQCYSFRLEQIARISIDKALDTMRKGHTTKQMAFIPEHTFNYRRTFSVLFDAFCCPRRHGYRARLIFIDGYILDFDNIADVNMQGSDTSITSITSVLLCYLSRLCTFRSVRSASHVQNHRANVVHQ